MADVPIDCSRTDASKSTRLHPVSPLPSNFVRHAYRSETRLFLLAAAGKALWSMCLIGINVVLLEVTNTKDDEQKRLALIFGFLGVCLLYVCADVACNYYSALLGSRVMSRLAARIAEHAILNGSPEASERAQALSLTSSDTQSVMQGIITLFDLAIAPFWFALVVVLLGRYASVVMSFSQMLQFCTIAACLAIIFGSLMMFISMSLTKAKKAINAAESKQVSTFVECLENIRTLRFYGWDNYMLQKLHRMTDDMMPLRLRLLKFKVINIAISFLASPIMCLTLLMVYACTIGGTPAAMKIDINILYAVTTMFDLIKFPLFLLPNAIRAASGASASYRRILDYFHRPTFEDQRQTAEVAGSLQMANFPVGPTTVLRKWQVEPGSLWILQGPVNSFKVRLVDCAMLFVLMFPLQSTILESIAGELKLQKQTRTRHISPVFFRASTLSCQCPLARRRNNELRSTSALAAASNNQRKHCLL
jgi:ABC-type multidrug transport system fused ATPase/permease subunit